MTQLVDASTAPNFAEDSRLIDPIDIGPRLLGDIDSEGSILRSLTPVMFPTLANELGIGDWMSSNATGGWKMLQVPLARNRVSSLVDDAGVQSSMRYEPYSARRGIQGAREWAAGLASVTNCPTRTTRVVPIVPEDHQAIPDTSAHTWNADLQALLLEEQLLGYFIKLVREAADEVFFDGMESVFSQHMNSAIGEYGDAAVHAIQRLLSSRKADAETAGEILRQMGSIGDPPTHRSRLNILTDQLKSPDPRIRDAASLGLAALDDPTAIGEVQKALASESSSRLRGNLRLVLDQLQLTQWQGS